MLLIQHNNSYRNVYQSSICVFHTNIQSSKLFLFNFFKNEKKDENNNMNPVIAKKALDTSKVESMKANLEKISMNQNIDYSKQVVKTQAIRVKDKQTSSYNAGKMDEFPNLYKGWMKSDGDQICKQIIGSTKRAIQGGEKYIEILFDPVPNLDEVAVGTAWNQKFRKEIAINLQVTELTLFVFFCNFLLFRFQIM